MTAALTLARMTTRQVLGVRRFVLLTLVAMLPAALFFFTSGQANGASNQEMFIGTVIGFHFSLIVPIVTVILATSALGDERRDQTLPFVVLRPISRTAIATAKLVGGVIGAAAISIIGAVLLAAMMGVRSGEWGNIAPLVVGTVIATLVYGAIFVPLGYLTERATLIGLAFVFIWEGAVVGVVPALASTSPWRVGFSAYVGMAPDEMLANVPDFALGTVLPGAGGAALKALVAVAIGIWFTRWILTHRDLT